MRACLGVAASLVIAMGVAGAQAKVTKLIVAKANERGEVPPRMIRASLGRTGAHGTADLPLPENVRREGGRLQPAAGPA